MEFHESKIKCVEVTPELGKKIGVLGTSLVVLCLRIHLEMQGTRVQSLVGELRFHMWWRN